MAERAVAVAVAVCLIGLAHAATAAHAGAAAAFPDATAWTAASGQRIATAIAADRAVFVSPRGDDRWTGRSPTPREAAEGPLASLEAALAVARGDAAIDTILLADGAYFVPRPVQLGAADAGLTIAAAPGAAPVLHGGLDLSAAQWAALEGGIHATRVDVAGLPRGVLDLHVAGRRQTPARQPNAVAGDPTVGWLFAAPGPTGHEHLAFHPGDVPPDLDPAGLRLWVTSDVQWASNVVTVAAIDHAARTIRLADNVPWQPVGEGSRYFLLGDPAFLDAPGEWHYEPATATLSFVPPDAARLADRTAVVAATTDSLIEIAGTRDVLIHGLTLRDGSPHGSDRHHAYNQIGGGAIRVTDSRNVTLSGNTIANVGVGITLLDVADVTVAANIIEHTAGNGILLGMAWDGAGSTAVTIAANTIRDVGHTFIDAAGVMLQGTADSRITGNLIERAAQFGVHGLQNRDAAIDPLLRNVVAGNVIRDVNLATADGGGIKLYAGMPGGAVGNVIRDNWIDGATHLMSRPDGTFFAADDWDPGRWPQPVSAALYLDWNISGTLITGNLVTASYGGVLLVNSDDNRVEHNVIHGGYGVALEVADQPVPARPPMSGNLFRGNVVVRDQKASAAVRVYDPTGGPPPARFAGNVYFGPALGDAAFLVQGRGRGGDLAGDLAAWTAHGDADGDEMLADPAFVDPDGLDFRLRADSPLPGLGILAPSPELLALLRALRVGAAQD